MYTLAGFREFTFDLDYEKQWCLYPWRTFNGWGMIAKCFETKEEARRYCDHMRGIELKVVMTRSNGIVSAGTVCEIVEDLGDFDLIVSFEGVRFRVGWDEYEVLVEG